MALGTLYFINGDEFFLIDEAVSHIKQSLPDADIALFEGQINVDEVVQSTQSTGLFASQKIIHIKNFSGFSKALSDADQGAWISFFSTPVPADCCVIVVHYGSVDKRKKLASTLKKHAVFQQHAAFKDWEQEKITGWLQQRFRKKGKTVYDDALFLFQQTGGPSLRQYAAELETLCTFLGDEVTQISLSHVKACCSPQQSTIYEFTEAIKQRNYPQIYMRCQQLLALGEDPIKLLGLLGASYRMYVQLLYLHQKGKTPDQMAKLMGRHPFFIKQLLGEVRKRYALSDVSMIMQNLATYDIHIKSGVEKARYIMDRLPVMLCQQPVKPELLQVL